jgi:hypothetical protein
MYVRAFDKRTFDLGLASSVTMVNAVAMYPMNDGAASAVLVTS